MSPPPPITESALGLDLSPRYAFTTAVVGSPAAAAETTVATLTVTQDLAIAVGIRLTAWCAFTVGTNGVSANLKIHHTNAAGATIAASGAVTVTAANLASLSAFGIDLLGVLPGQIYIATL